MGYRSDSIAVSRDMGPLSCCCRGLITTSRAPSPLRLISHSPLLWEALSLDALRIAGPSERESIRRKTPTLEVSEMASAKMASAIDVRIDDAGSILKFRIGFPFGENSAGFCQSVWLPESILNFRIGSVSSIGGLIAATLFADTISDSQIPCGPVALHSEFEKTIPVALHS